MSTIVTRAGKGSALTHNEVDANFVNLNTDKLQSGNTAAALTITSATINGGTITGTALNGTLGATTPSTVAATTISASGVSTFSAGSAGAPSITNSGDTNTGMFFPAADTIAFAEGGAEAMRINSSGIMLINSSSVDATSGISGAKLQVLGGIIAGIDGLGSGGTGYIAFNSAMASAPTTAHPVIYHRQSVGLGIQSDYAISFAINGSTEAMRLDSSGNLGLGVTPSAWGSTYKAVQVGIGSSFTGMTNDVNLNLANNARFDGTNWIYLANSPAERYRIWNGQHQWFNSASGTAGNTITFTQAMTLDASGNLLVGKTTAGTGGGNGIQISKTNMTYVCSESSGGNGCYEFYSSNIGAYRFYVTSLGTIFATNTTITAISDQRLKENVRDLDYGLDKIIALQPRRFDWKEGKGLNKKDDVGFIAQEFETVFPQSVVGSKAGEDGIEYKALNHSELIPTLVKAIQEQQAMIDELKAKVAALEAA
jgi:hypothetical protein